MTNLEAKQALATKLNINWSQIANNELFSADEIQQFVQFGLAEAWDLHAWPFAELTYTIPLSAQDVSDGFTDFPEDMMLGSIRRLAVGGKEYYGPVRFEDYLKSFEDNSTSTDKIWAFHEMFLFINPQAYTVGDALDILGKEIAPTLSADADLLPFSPIADNKEHAGNKAIVELAYAHALSSEKMKRIDDADKVRKDAYASLAILWKPFSEYKSLQQSLNRPMFDVPDFFGRGNSRSENHF